MDPSPGIEGIEMDSDTPKEDVSSIQTTAHSKKAEEPDKQAVDETKQLNRQVGEDEDEPSKSTANGSALSHHSDEDSKIQRKRNSGRRSPERERDKRVEHKKSRLGTEHDRSKDSKLLIDKVKSRSQSKSSQVGSSDEGHTTRRRSLSSESTSPRRSWARNNRRDNKSRSPQEYSRASMQMARSRRSQSVDRIRYAGSRATPSHDAGYRQRRRRHGSSIDRNSGRSSAVRTRGNVEDRYPAPMCNDFQAFGFCIRGDLCSFDHGENATLVEGGCRYRGAVGQQRAVYVSNEPRLSHQVASLQNFFRTQSYDPQFPQYNPPINPYTYTQVHGGGVSYGPYANSPFDFPGMQRSLNMYPTALMNPAHGQMVPYGPLPTSHGHISGSYDGDASRCTISLQNVPSHLRSIPELHDQFAGYGNITLIQVMRNNDPTEALLSFSNATEASNAMVSIRTTNMDGIEATWFIDQCISESQGHWPKQSWASNRGRGTNRRHSNRNVVVLDASTSPREQQEELTGRNVHKKISTGITSASFPGKNELIKRMQNRVLAFSIYLKGVETERNLETEEIIKKMILPLQQDGKSKQEIDKALGAKQKEYLKLIIALKDGDELTEEQQLLVDGFLSKSATPPPDLSQRSGYNPPPGEMNYEQAPTHRRCLTRSPVNYIDPQLPPMEDISITINDSDDDDVRILGESDGESDSVIVIEKEDKKVEEDTFTIPGLGGDDNVTNRGVSRILTYDIDKNADPVVEDAGTFQDQNYGRGQSTPEIKKENVTGPQAGHPQRSGDHSSFHPYWDNSYSYGYRGHSPRGSWRSSRGRRGNRGWIGGKNPYKVDHTREFQ